MPQAWIPPRGELGKKVVFSPCCGDETTTYYDRAQKIQKSPRRCIRETSDGERASAPPHPTSAPFTKVFEGKEGGCERTGGFGEEEGKRGGVPPFFGTFPFSLPNLLFYCPRGVSRMRTGMRCASRIHSNVGLTDGKSCSPVLPFSRAMPHPMLSTTASRGLSG